MTGTARGTSIVALAAALAGRAATTDRRYLVGIAGPPGAGKSTLSVGLCAALNARAGGPIAELAPMDGYHLPNARLEKMGRRAAKGEPDTFDSAGYVENLARLRGTPLGEPVAWPTFDRALDEPTPAGVVFTGERIVVTEGNYLLVDDPALGAWHGARALLDECWYLDAGREVLTERLLRRHLDGGRSDEAARDKVASSDLRNADLVAATRHRADLVLRAEGGRYAVLAEPDLRDPADAASVLGNDPKTLSDRNFGCPGGSGSTLDRSEESPMAHQLSLNSIRGALVAAGAALVAGGATASAAPLALVPESAPVVTSPVADAGTGSADALLGPEGKFCWILNPSPTCQR